MIKVEIVEDSISLDGIRLTTLKLIYPRFIHSEFMTHRMFSRNASSSRAIPMRKMREFIRKEMAMPIEWGLNRPGMQADTLAGRAVTTAAAAVWTGLGYIALGASYLFEKLNIHKQISNRVLEPWMHINVLVTATEWANFFFLRTDTAAQPEFRSLALKMKEIMELHVPEERDIHLPFVTEEERKKLSVDKCMKISAARCARVSYLTFEGKKPDIEKDLQLANKLLAAGHMSPFEHQGISMANSTRGLTHTDVEGVNWSGNFREWNQYRHMI